MATLGISEFTFGYAFLYEQTNRNWGSLRAAPILPSLQQEADQGWDAHLPTNGVDYYYQFKLSDYLYTANAKYRKDMTYDSPYFRIAFHKHDNNRQHRRLKAHAELHPNTYYVAPEITFEDDFNDIFLNRQVTEHSRLFPLNECDDVPDGDQHYITYQKSISDWIQHSDKKRHGFSVEGKNLQKEYEEASKQMRRLDRTFAENLFSKTAQTVRKLIESEAGLGLPDREGPIRKLIDERVMRESKENIVKRVSQILSVFFGLTLVVISERQKV